MGVRLSLQSHPCHNRNASVTSNCSHLDGIFFLVWLKWCEIDSSFWPCATFYVMLISSIPRVLWWVIFSRKISIICYFVCPVFHVAFFLMREMGMLSSMRDATIGGNRSFWHELKWVFSCVSRFFNRWHCTNWQIYGITLRTNKCSWLC